MRMDVTSSSYHSALYAYAVQCPRKDAKAIDAMMKNTFRNEGQMYVKAQDEEDVSGVVLQRNDSSK
jgi:hypothetical protein